MDTLHKILWTLIGINSLGLLLFVIFYFVMNDGKNVDTIESSWMLILVITGLLIILLAALPLYFSHSTFSLFVSGFFAALPLILTVTIFINKNLPSFKKSKSMAVIYYKNKKQQAIAAAIENNDTVLLKQLIIGQDLNIQGTKVWGWDGLNFLQFAIRLRSGAGDLGINANANKAAIHILVENGSEVTPAFNEAVKYLPPEEVKYLLNAGADPNTRGFANSNPLLFELIGSSKKDNDMAILLLENGAYLNIKYENGFTPVMFAAFNAGTSTYSADAWRLVFYMLEIAKCDYTYISKDGVSLQNIITKIRSSAAKEKVTMPPDFNKVVAWLKQHKIETSAESIVQ